MSSIPGKSSNKTAPKGFLPDSILAAMNRIDTTMACVLSAQEVGALLYYANELRSDVAALHRLIGFSRPFPEFTGRNEGVAYHDF